jgi:toxin HigB-1
MKDIFDVILTDKVKKQLRKLPQHIIDKLYSWVDDVAHVDITRIQKIPGYHDEPLIGKRKGQRSIRLNNSYRAIYIELDNGTISFIEVTEVNKHEY